ncbi:uncharacterized protein SPPG_04741 [Spizellomyces punctatus DAOM BR117]|uniref:Hydin adenylate kinase-like domain-containing protein n=1 Tax=Spizellomyces punctatus (strain DAOM BR117) TaxID=645134 RepID=A0A0L0HHX4_SPIPD|nr:uncharacterized protein SPPG_04741 [Spizellomyces punctatus DAOM BR117]KND00419.1 hypothetical protein SPPG_04741 [Spizellomyces punctatus DAOM BR117]|eukprot:XP_016608458.1 hypothetical protein SPPG_04741 [Spizellomyces punctatus DAOM BR117]
MKVFVSNVDGPLGHNVSRLLATTVVGSRREEEPEEEETDENEDRPKEEKPKEIYTVVGTMTRRNGTAPEETDDSLAHQLVPIVETGDKKRDAVQKEAIEKFAIAGQKPKWVTETVPRGDRTLLKETLLSCDVIIYDIISCLDEASWAIEMLAEEADNFAEKPKVFIGVTSVMTWARTKVDAEDPDAFLAEDDYRRRKPHPNFKSHILVEKNIVKHGKKSALKTYVIAAGLVYHPGDSIFHFLFKSAWHNQDLVCYGDGDNVIPTISLDDLSNIIVETVETTPASKYMLAIDDSKNTLYEITKAVSDTLGTGKVKKLPKEAALLNKDLPQSDYDMLLVNLRLDPGHIKEMSFEWKYESGLVENLTQFIQEYKYARGLTPLRIVVHGPPASGKTFYANKIAQHYEIHIINVEKVVEEAIARLERRASGRLTPDEADDDIDADKELFEELKEAARANNGRYPEEHVVNFVREKLRSMPCRNQGYILDGYPTSLDEARELFKAADDDDAKEESKIPKIDELIGPDKVISLDASDDVIKDRIMNLPESAVAGTKNSEDALTRRLEEFRASNTDENTVLNFFDELEIHPIIISVEANDADAVMSIVTKTIGRPHNYGPSPEQIAEKKRLAEEAKAREIAAAEEERLKREKEEAERQSKAVAEWNLKLEEVRKQEQEVLEAQSVPLRNYLMKYVMPTLTSGLIEVCKVRPEDPIDYLAEFLFKHNPGNA